MADRPDRRAAGQKRRRNSITWVKPPVPTRHPRGRHGPCEWCRLGDHHLCTHVGCYRCPPENHARLPGVTMTEHRP